MCLQQGRGKAATEASRYTSMDIFTHIQYIYNKVAAAEGAVTTNPRWLPPDPCSVFAHATCTGNVVKGDPFTRTYISHVATVKPGVDEALLIGTQALLIGAQALLVGAPGRGR